MLVRITNPRANNKSEQEFLVKKSVESARVGRKGIIFHLDVETIMLKFNDEEKCRKFTAMVSAIR